MTYARIQRGRSGEDVAAEWYETNNYTVLARNWRCREGEIDLIATDGSCLVISEVKTRSSTRFGTPADAVTPTKQRRLRMLAARYLADSSAGFKSRTIRFDVVSVTPAGVEVIESAF